MAEPSLAIEIAPWIDPQLPPDIGELLEEAIGSGHDWAADFRPAWNARPFTGDGEALFLARAGERLLGMAAISADPFVLDESTGRLRFIYVVMSARRLGIADSLVDRCLALARGHWRRLRLHTDNPLAAPLYERRGFRPSANELRATHVMDLATS